jgi:NAD(P)-dependent dehydrogenase (short-subunit alcohol dehydrogenase family)
VALVVGAGDGLGAAVARRFASEGMLVCVVRRDGAKLAPLVRQVRALAPPTALQLQTLTLTGTCRTDGFVGEVVRCACVKTHGPRRLTRRQRPLSCHLLAATQMSQAELEGLSPHVPLGVQIPLNTMRAFVGAC